MFLDAVRIACSYHTPFTLQVSSRYWQCIRCKSGRCPLADGGPGLRPPGTTVQRLRRQRDVLFRVHPPRSGNVHVGLCRVQHAQLALILFRYGPAVKAGPERPRCEVRSPHCLLGLRVPGASLYVLSEICDVLTIRFE